MVNKARRPPRAPIGFRLANELEGLLRGVAADGIITQDECKRLGRWIAANEEYTDLKPFNELAMHVRQVLSDGTIDQSEIEDLLFVVSKLTTVNPHFDQVRGGLQVLMGVLAGIAADHHLDDREVLALSAWLDEWRHLQGLWPFDECESIVTAMLSTRRVAEDAGYLLSLAEQFPVAGVVDSRGWRPPLLLSGVCAVDPEIRFRANSFVFTGESSRGARLMLEGAVKDRGGVVASRVSTDCHFLVVCDGGSPHWAFSCYGRKVEQAYSLRREGHGIQIIHEQDFWDALASTPTRVQ